MKAARRYRFIYTDEWCRIGKRTYPGIPMLIEAGVGTVVWPVTDFLRAGRVDRRLALATVKSYADQLALFWRYLEAQDVDWQKVDQTFLRDWVDEQSVARDAKGGRVISDRTINGRLNTVIAFYLWAQDEAGLVIDRIGESSKQDQKRTVYPIQLKRMVSDRGERLVSTLLIRTTGPAREAHTPNDEEMRQFHSALAHGVRDPGLQDRNALIAMWKESIGTRGHEIAALQVDQLPSWDELDALREEHGPDARASIRLEKTKGGKARNVLVPCELLEATRDYIDSSRLEVSQRVRRPRPWVQDATADLPGPQDGKGAE